jgi:8-oxo-dGTP pyrophosphatase MutT (NUDIX family)
MKTNSVNLRVAATLVVVRDASSGPEVLLLRRADKGDHNSGAWVFPGGLIDSADHRSHEVCIGLDDVQASARLGVEAGGLDYYVAAIRECFEEAGLLFAVDEGGQVVNLHSKFGERLSALRGRLNSGDYEFIDFCRDFALGLSADRLFYIGHWLTPKGRAKRFDTRFFLAILPDGQSSMHDDFETVEQVWLTPLMALSAENTRRLMAPTRAMIEQIGTFANTSALLNWARSPRQVACVLPRLATTFAGPCPVLPNHPAWAEVGRLDPEGRGDAWCEIRPGVPVRLSHGVFRLSAGRSGSHSYLIDIGNNEWAVIDPGPQDEGHLDAVIAVASGPIRWIFLTDGDAEQVESAAQLQARTGAQVRGPQQNNEAVPGITLRALPGPTANSISYLLVQEKMLFVGAQTVPTAWLAEQHIEWLAPRRGFLVTAPPHKETR